MSQISKETKEIEQSMGFQTTGFYTKHTAAYILSVVVYFVVIVLLILLAIMYL